MSNNLLPEEVFVIKSYDETYKTSKIETLLLNKDKKAEYDSIYNLINNKKEKVVFKLAGCSGLSNAIVASQLSGFHFQTR